MRYECIASSIRSRHLFCASLQGDRLFSQAHDELYQFNFEKQRWGPLALRPTRGGRKQEAAVGATAQPAAADGTADEATAAATVAATAEQRHVDGSPGAQPSGQQRCAVAPSETSNHVVLHKHSS